MMNQPLLVFGESPERVSAAVIEAILLIAPVEFEGDLRPYLTIFDPELKPLQSEHDLDALRSIVLGLSNPLFLRVLTLDDLQL